jgi:hypothetical protein
VLSEGVCAAEHLLAGEGEIVEEGSAIKRIRSCKGKLGLLFVVCIYLYVKVASKESYFQYYLPPLLNLIFYFV